SRNRRARRSSSSSSSGLAGGCSDGLSNSMLGSRLQVADELDLLALAEPVEAPRLTREIAETRTAEVPLLEIAAVAERELAGHPVSLRAFRRQATREVVFVEEKLAQARRDGAFVLGRQEEDGVQILV